MTSWDLAQYRTGQCLVGNHPLCSGRCTCGCHQPPQLTAERPLEASGGEEADPTSGERPGGAERKYPETIETHPDQPPWYVYDLGDNQRLGSPSPMTDTQVEQELRWLDGQPVDTALTSTITAKVLVPDDTVPVEKLAHWLHGEYGGPYDWHRSEEWQREAYRRTARALMSQLPELFR